MVFSLILVWCWTKTTTDENIDNESINNQEESNFSMSDCLKWCEMMWDQKTSRDQMLKDCSNICQAGNAMDKNNPAGCENSEWIMRDTCYSSVAYETATVDLCKKINDKPMQYGCYTSIAEKTKDASICTKLEDAIWKASCEEAAK